MRIRVLFLQVWGIGGLGRSFGFSSGGFIRDVRHGEKLMNMGEEEEDRGQRKVFFFFCSDTKSIE